MDKYVIKSKRKAEESEEEKPRKRAKVVEDEEEEQKEEEEEVSTSSEEKKVEEHKEITFDNFEELVHPSWQTHLSGEFKKQYFKNLKKFLKGEEKKHGANKIFPAKNEIFNAFNHCHFDKVKVVILGQDPYQTPKFAHGLAFSVKPGITVPKSLANIYKELTTDIDGFSTPKHGTLTKWADQGVLLLNTVLTVRDGVSNSHKNQGWEQFTDFVIDLINKKKDNVVFILWGKPAEKKGAKVDKKKHKVLTSFHPSPLSASKGFFGCKHFSACNKYLVSKGESEINWQV